MRSVWGTTRGQGSQRCSSKEGNKVGGERARWERAGEDLLATEDGRDAGTPVGHHGWRGAACDSCSSVREKRKT